MAEFKISPIREGRPVKITDEKERACYDLLDKLKIKYQRVDYNFYPTTEVGKELITETLGTLDIKNLVFNDKHHRHYYLVVMLKKQRFDQKAFRNAFHLVKITMSSADDLKKVSNSHPGAISITELMYDQAEQVGVYFQSDVLATKYFRFHPNENHATLRISTNDLVHKLMPGLHHEIHRWEFSGCG